MIQAYFLSLALKIITINSVYVLVATWRGWGSSSLPGRRSRRGNGTDGEPSPARISGSSSALRPGRRGGITPPSPRYIIPPSLHAVLF